MGAVTSTFRATDFVFNTYLDTAVNNMTVTKSTGAANPVSPGDTIPYTVTVSNPGTRGPDGSEPLRLAAAGSDLRGRERSRDGASPDSGQRP